MLPGSEQAVRKCEYGMYTCMKAKSRFTERYYIGKYNIINICYTVIYFNCFW